MRGVRLSDCLTLELHNTDHGGVRILQTHHADAMTLRRVNAAGGMHCRQSTCLRLCFENKETSVHCAGLLRELKRPKLS
jgi:hypothetical protein